MLSRKKRTALIVGAPIVSVATLMLGLRVGAGDAVRSASVFVAPPARPAFPDASRPLALQVMTYLEDRGVRETIAIANLTVVVRQNGKESRWTGASNADGIAEASLTVPERAPFEVAVLAAGEAQPLASGMVTLPAPRVWGREPDDERSSARPSKREGPLGLDVVVEGERLVVGFGTPLWLHVTGAKLPVTVHATPEVGLRLTKEVVSTSCEWAELEAVAEGHVSGMKAEAKDAETKTGTWFGALPVAPGAFFIDAPRALPEGKSSSAVLVAPNPRTVAYAEVDDEEGRVLGAVLPLVRDPSDPMPKARLGLPPLAAGLHWLVVSGEPRGAEHLSGAAIAKPFVVGSASGVDPAQPCSLGPWLARRPASGFPRTVGLDGMITRGASNRARHRTGLLIGLVSLFAAAVLEVLLLTAASREARAVMLLADLDEPAAERHRVTARPPGGGLAVALLVALLGFALLAALMIARA